MWLIPCQFKFQMKCAYPLSRVFKPVSCIFVHAAAARASGPLTVCCWSSLAGGWSAVTPPGRRLTLKVTPIYVLNAIRHCQYMRRNQNKITRHVSNGGARLISTKSHANMRTTLECARLALSLSITLGDAHALNAFTTVAHSYLEIKDDNFNALFWKVMCI